MKNTFVRAVTYAYPYLKTVESDYGECIKNRALLSYRSGKSAEEISISIAEDILEQRKLVWLKGVVESVLAILSDTERMLVAIRYFGKERKKRATVGLKGKALREAQDKARADKLGKTGTIGIWSERKYFRAQQRLCERLKALYIQAGLTEEVFEKEFLSVEIMEKIYRFAEEKDGRLSKREKAWVGDKSDSKI